jgi:hypothetical protein
MVKVEAKWLSCGQGVLRRTDHDEQIAIPGTDRTATNRRIDQRVPGVAEPLSQRPSSCRADGAGQDDWRPGFQRLEYAIMAEESGLGLAVVAYREQGNVGVPASIARRGLRGDPSVAGELPARLEWVESGDGVPAREVGSHR